MIHSARIAARNALFRTGGRLKAVRRDGDLYYVDASLNRGNGLKRVTLTVLMRGANPSPIWWRNTFEARLKSMARTWMGSPETARQISLAHMDMAA